MKSSTIAPICLSVIAVIVSVTAFIAPSFMSGPRVTGTIGLINMQQVMKESTAGVSLTSQVEPKQKALQDESKAKAKEFQQQVDEITKLKPSLTAEAIDQKTKALQDKITEWNASMKKRQDDLSGAVNTALQAIQQNLREQLADIARENGFAAIISTDQAFYAESKLDVTPEAIRRLDAKIKKVTIKFDDK